MKKIGKKEAILAALEEAVEDNIQDHEFTLKDFIGECHKAGKTLCLTTAKTRLAELVKKGKLNCRKIAINGNLTNVYSQP
jgi:hypothetical protein